MNSFNTDEVEAGLRERAAIGWKRVKEAFDALEPIVLELITRRVRAHVSDAKAILLEPSDQGGSGWVFQSTVLSDGSRLGADDPRIDELSDDDELTGLLLDFGEFVSSETEPYPFELALDQEPKLVLPAPLGWDEFWRLIYAPAAEASEPPEDGVNALSAADTCAELYNRLAPDPGATEIGRALWDERETRLEAPERADDVASPKSGAR